MAQDLVVETGLVIIVVVTMRAKLHFHHAQTSLQRQARQKNQARQRGEVRHAHIETATRRQHAIPLAQCGPDFIDEVQMFQAVR